MAKAIRDMAEPDAEESELEVVPERGLSKTQQNYKFNILVGINLMQVEEMIQEGRTMLEHARVQAAQAEQVAAEVYREACSRVQHLTEVVKRLQHCGQP